MPIPKINFPICKLSQEQLYASNIIQELNKKKYHVENERAAVTLIESVGIKNFDFDYPYGSFETFKEHVLAGEFDVKNKIVKPNNHERLNQLVKEGKLWRMD